MHRSSNFEFVDIGAPSGQGGKYPGWIFIAQYRVRQPRPKIRRYGYDYNEFYLEEEMAAPPSAESRAKAFVPSTGAETGAGRVVQHPVEEVERELESEPTGLAAIFYSKELPRTEKPSCSPWLGIEALSNIDDGVYVSYVYPNSPAAMAGLERGDVILSFDGIRVRYLNELQDLIANCYGGQRVYLEVKNVRDGRIYDVTAYIGCR